MIHIANIWEDVNINAQIKCIHTKTVAAVAVSEGCSVVLFCALLKMELRAISILNYSATKIHTRLVLFVF